MKPLTPSEIWEATLGELQVQVSRSNYRTWLAKTSALGYQDSTFVVGVPSTFVAEYLEQNQRSLIEKALITFTAPDVRVAFQVNGKRHTPVVSGEPQGDLSGRLSTTPRFNSRFLFDSFIEGPGNRLARSAALAVAQQPGRAYNPLFVHGGVGLGKTHLLHAIGHEATTHHVPVICLSAERFTSEFVRAVRDKRAEEFHLRYRSAGMLLIDDLQFISGKPHTEESFFHTFNELHNANRQVVVTSDRHPREMSQFAERLRSRLEGGLTVEIHPPDEATRLAILRANPKSREIQLPGDVLEFIARQDRRNIRELEGSLNRVVAFAHLLHATPTVELAARALQSVSHQQEETAAVTPEKIISAVAASFQMSAADITGSRRDKEAVLARRAAMYLLRQETNLPLAKIGRETGGRDASAAANACKKTAAELTGNPWLKNKVVEIQGKLRQT